MLNTLCIYGSGGTGCEIVDMARRIQTRHQTWERIVFVDDFKTESVWYETPVLNFESLSSERGNYEFVIAQGEPKNRQNLYTKVTEMGFSCTKVIDPTAIISPTAELADGVIVFPFSFISSHTRISCNVMIEINVIIGHDITVGAHSVISSSTVVGGKCSIGKSTFIGLNATVKDRVAIGDSCILSMGSSVFQDIGHQMIAVGNPARVIRKNDGKAIFN